MLAVNATQNVYLSVFLLIHTEFQLECVIEINVFVCPFRSLVYLTLSWSLLSSDIQESWTQSASGKRAIQSECRSINS